MFYFMLALPLIVSIAYYQNSPTTESVASRLLVSAHGCTIFGLFVMLLVVDGLGIDKNALGDRLFRGFEFLCLIPIALILVSFKCFRGSPKVHFFQIGNAGVLFYMLALADWILHPWP